MNAIKTQVEYYLSDQNLQSDEFFHKEITNNEAGYLQLQYILKCNKIKSQNITLEQIVEAVSTSDLVELNDTKTSIRRKDNKPLPEFKGKNKMIKNNQGEAVPVIQEHKDEQFIDQPRENPYDNFEPLIFTVKSPEGVHVTWSQITEALMKQHNISAPYVRFGKVDGNFALSKPRTPEENIGRLTSEGVKIGEHQLSICVTEDEDLKQFWSHHGKHLETIINRAKDTFNHGGAGKGGKKDDKHKKLRKEIVFHNQKYRDISQLKNIFKTILARSENGVALKEPYHSMIVSLLQFHDKKDQKLNDLKSFTVGSHPEHKDTRCFFAMKNDGSQEDFSCLKCIRNFEATLQ